MSKIGLDDFLVTKDANAYRKLKRERVIKANPIAPLQAGQVHDLIDNTPKPIPMLINNLLAESVVAAIIAQGGTSKSFAALQIACSICTGSPVFGIGDFRPSTGPVIYLTTEDDRHIIQIRLHEIIRISNYSKKDAEKIKNNLIVFYVGGDGTLLTEAQGRDCVRTNYAERIIVTAKEIKNLKLIIIDPVASFRGGDENSTTDNQRYIETCRYITNRTGATILNIHHGNKESTRSKTTDQNASRGSSAFTDGLRAQINMARMNASEAKTYGLNYEESTSYVKFILTKANYTKLTGEIWLKRSEGGALTYAPLVKKEDTEDLETLEQIIDVIRSETEKGNEYSPRGFADRFSGKDEYFGVGRDKINKLIKKAVDDGDLVLAQPDKPMRNVRKVLKVNGEKNVVKMEKVAKWRD